MSSDQAPGTAVPERAVAAVATVGALVLLAGVALSARGTATADLPTVLVAADAGTVLVTAAGERAARPGDLVPQGARVRTAAGAAALATDGRTVRLAPGSEVVVVDGARQRLERGAALVDAADGPAVRLTAAGSTVAVRDDGVVRVDRERLLRVASYRGAADVRAPGRRRTAVVRPLHQLQVASGGLAGQVVPLALRPGDAWEREQVPALVEDDLLLQRTVRSLADAPALVAAALPAAERPAGGEASAERALAYALAHEGGGDFDLDTYLEVQEGRGLGGSWGVVAALADASPSDAERFLDGALDGGATAPATLLAGGAPADLATEVLGTLPGFAPPADADADVADPGRARPEPSRGGTTASPRPTARPTRSPAPSRGPVEEVLDAVRDVLPSPLPTAPPAPAPTRPPAVQLEVDAPVLDEVVDTVTGVLGR